MVKFPLKSKSPNLIEIDNFSESFYMDFFLSIWLELAKPAWGQD